MDSGWVAKTASKAVQTPHVQSKRFHAFDFVSLIKLEDFSSFGQPFGKILPN